MQPLRSRGRDGTGEPPVDTPDLIEEEREQPEPQFRIELVFEGVDEVPSSAVIHLIEAIERSALVLCEGQYDRVKEETLKPGSPLRGVGADEVYALFRAIREREGKLFLIRGSRRGSFVLYGTIIAGLWLLKNTVGVSVVEGYKRSKLNERLANHFRDLFDYDVGQLAERCGYALSEKFAVLSVNVRRRQIGPIIVISMVLTELTDQAQSPMKH